MGDREKFGTIEEKPVRKYWENEARDFTPWLANNIQLLGEALGLDDLEVEEREASIGSFHVDILCKYGSGQVAIVENQLEKTDHTHLGQLLTYAAGKEAAAVIWICSGFTEEHRAALDWLNSKTGSDVHFFGVQIKVWQIGSSAPAPKFEVFCKPNEWAETVKNMGALDDREKACFAFWSGLQQYMEKQGGRVKPKPASGKNWAVFPIGGHGFHLEAYILFPTDQIVLHLVSNHERHATEYYRRLHAQQNEIERELKTAQALTWHEFPDKHLSRITVRWKKCGSGDKNKRDALYAWMHEHLGKFHAVFYERIQNIAGGQRAGGGRV